MKQTFYLQHSLMALCDHRMEKLIDAEGLKGLGAYWFILEKLAMRPRSRAQMEHLKPFCKKRKIPFSYLWKIISGFGLFVIEEDGFFSPAELNSDPENEGKSAKKGQKSAVSGAKRADNCPKRDKKVPENASEKSDNRQKNSDLRENNTPPIKENTKDIITTATAEEKENEKDSSSSSTSTSAIVIQNPEEDSPHRPLESWRKMVDDLALESSWLDLACMKSGYGVLLKRRIREAVDYFKQHVEVYDKGGKLLNMSEVKSYFVNYVRAGTKTSKELQEKLCELESQQRPPAVPDPYRYELRVNGQRTYRGCPIPDNAPPRPNADAFWSDITQSWGSPFRTATANRPQCHI